MGTMVKVGELELFVEEAGTPSGQPTVFLHGGLGLDHTYLRAFDRLPDRRLIYFDQRANGRSTGGLSDDVTMATLAADVVALSQTLGLGPVDVIGHSYGGFVALEMALRHPDAVRRLVLLGTIPGYTEEYSAQVQEQVTRLDPSPEVRAAMAMDPESSEAFGEMLVALLPLYVYSIDPSVLAAGLSETRYNIDALRMGLGASREWDVTAELDGIHAPTLVMCGRHDFICPAGQSEVMAQRIPDARLAVFEQSGHFPWLEEPDEFWASLDSFLGADEPALETASSTLGGSSPGSSVG